MTKPWETHKVKKLDIVSITSPTTMTRGSRSHTSLLGKDQQFYNFWVTLDPKLNCRVREKDRGEVFL